MKLVNKEIKHDPVSFGPVLRITIDVPLAFVMDQQLLEPTLIAESVGEQFLELLKTPTEIKLSEPPMSGL
jgi:hypothetical protein